MTQSIERTTPAIDEAPLQFWEGDRVQGQSLKDGSTIEGTVQSVGRKYLKLTSGEAIIIGTAQMLDPGAEVIEVDPRMQPGAYVSTPGGLKAYVLKPDPKEPDTRVIIEYVNKGMGTDNYPYRNLTLIQAAPEPEPIRRAIAPTPDIDEEDEDEGPDLKVGDRVWYGESTNTGIISDLQYPDVAVRFDHGSTVTVAYHRLHPVEVLVEFSDGSTVIVEQGAQYTPGFLAEEEAAQLLEFSEALAWQHNSFRIFGKETKLPRLEVMFGDPGCTYRYSNVELEPLPWPPELQALRERVEAATGCKYQVVIGNLYRSGADHIGWHADDSKEMGRNPAIASISLGATRRFDVRSKAGGEVQSFELSSGDLVFMPSGFQNTHKHRIAKTSKECGVRINWTFRPHVGGAPKPEQADAPRKFQVGDRVWYAEPANTGSITELDGREARVLLDHGFTVTLQKAEMHFVEVPLETTPVEVIPNDPSDRLTQLEGEILQGMKLVEEGRAKVWQAVAAIRAENLWEINGHKSFKEYVQVRFGWKEAYAHEIASAGETATQLLNSGVPESSLPQSADAYRHLKKLPTEQATEAIQKATEATGGKPTAKAVKAAVAEIQGKSEAITPALDPLPLECKPSISPEEFNAVMRESAEARSAGCMSCRHQRMTGSGDRYSCEQKEFDGTLLLKQNWFVENEGCKSFSHPAAEPMPTYEVPKGVARIKPLPDGGCILYELPLSEKQVFKLAALARSLDGSRITAIQHLIDQLPEVEL